MTISNYLEQEMLKLNQDSKQTLFEGNLVDEVTRLILTKKFRKTSISDEQRSQIRIAVAHCVGEGKPIQLTLVFGGYKLWRLKESPDVDWAELFSLMYYTKWMKPICDIYEPGVWFDFYSDDVIIPELNNIGEQDIEIYQKGFSELLKYIRKYQPENLTMTLNRVKEQYNDLVSFNEDLESKKTLLRNELNGGLPQLSDKAKATVELNVRATDEQKINPLWREEVQFLHDSYAMVDERRPYYRRLDKICVFTAPYPDMLSVGTTKDSIVKFWVGVGVIKDDVKNQSFRRLILSPSQLENSEYEVEAVSINGLSGKNFSGIRRLV